LIRCRLMPSFGVAVVFGCTNDHQN
jgi:hypothetical protein